VERNVHCHETRKIRLSGSKDRPSCVDTSNDHSCKRLGLFDNLSAYFIPANKRPSRVSSRAVMSGGAEHVASEVKPSKKTARNGALKQKVSNRQLKVLNDGLSRFFTASGKRLSVLSRVSTPQKDDRKSRNRVGHVIGAKPINMGQLKSSLTVGKSKKFEVIKMCHVAGWCPSPPLRPRVDNYEECCECKNDDLLRRKRQETKTNSHIKAIKTFCSSFLTRAHAHDY
jgi:hypothetical protein